MSMNRLHEALNRPAAKRATTASAASTAVTLVAALACALCFSANAIASPSRVINIPPGELATALDSVAQQAGVELLFQPDQLKGIHTNGVVGVMTARQAVKKLLEGTPLQLRTDPDNDAMMIAAAGAGAAPEPGAGTPALTPQEEVEVTARRAKLSAMRAEMVKLEDRFYTEYNRLNTDHWWDVLCGRERLADRTHPEARVCRPRFEAQKMSPNGFGGIGDNVGAFVAPVPENRDLILKKWASYEKNMSAQIDKSPELQRLIREREDLQQRYEATRKAAFNGKIYVFD
jgi:hypothetical protein